MKRDNQGCLKVGLTLVALYVVWQVAVLWLRVADAAFSFAGALLKWLGLGLTGAGGLVAMMLLVGGVSAGAVALWRRIATGRRKRRELYQAQYRHYLRAREWRQGIGTLAQRLRRRKWLSREDTRRYLETADLAVARLHTLDEDLIVMDSLPAAQPWTPTICDGAERILHHLERTHNALARLLAQSAVQAIPAMEEDVQQAADELQALLAALEHVSSQADAGPFGMSEEQALQSVAGSAAAAGGEPQSSRREPESEVQR